MSNTEDHKDYQTVFYDAGRRRGNGGNSEYEEDDPNNPYHQKNDGDPLSGYGYGSGHSEVNNTTNNIYQYQDGRINLRNFGPDRPASDNIAEATTEYTKHPWKTDENSIYENYRRADRAAAVASFVIGDYHTLEKAQAFDQLDFSQIKSGTDAYSRMGYGYAAENKMNQEFAQTSFRMQNEADGSAAGFITGEQLFKQSPLTNAQMRELAERGAVNINGTHLTFENQGEALHFADNYNQAMQERVRREPFLNAVTNKERADALNTARIALMQDLKSNERFLNFGDDTRRPENMTREAFLNQECQETLTLLQNENAASLSQQRNMLQSAGYDIHTDGGVLDAYKTMNNQIDDLTFRVSSLEQAKNESKTSLDRLSSELTQIRSRKMAPPRGETYDSYVKKLQKQIEEQKSQLDGITDNLEKHRDSLGKSQILKRDLDKLQKRIDTNAGYLKTIAELEKTTLYMDDAKYQNRRAYGARIVQNKFIGRDMTFGMDAWKMYGKGSQMCVEAVHRASISWETKQWEKKAQILQQKGRELSNFSQKYRDQLAFADQENKFYLEAKKNGTLKNYKNERQSRLDARKLSQSNQDISRNREMLSNLEHRKAKQESIGKSLSDRETKEMERLKRAITRKEKGSSKRTAKMDAREERLKSKKERRQRKEETKRAKQEAFARTRLGKWTEKWRERFSNWVIKFNKFNPMNWVRNALKAALAKLAPMFLAAGGFFLAFFITMALMAVIIVIAIFFISELVQPTDLVNGLNAGIDGMNYVQVIVNDSSTRLANSFKLVAEKDAYVHYADMSDEELLKAASSGKNGESALLNDKYDWYREIQEGKIANAYRSEDAGKMVKTPCFGLNDNIVPITSMMHFRFLDDIDYLNWQTARGYIYYLFVQSHDVGDYSIKQEDDCSSIYGTPFVASNYVTENNGSFHIDRPVSTCSNVYIHGRDKEKYSQNRRRALAAEDDLSAAFFNHITSVFSDAWGTLFSDGVEQGVWVDDWDGTSEFQKPKDAVGVCDTAQAIGSKQLTTVRKSEEDYSEDAWRAAVNAGTSSYLICPGYEHTHSPADCRDADCWKYVETKDAAGNVTGGAYQTTKTEHVHGDGTCVYACGQEEHTHGNGCDYICGKEEHHHDWQCYTKAACGACYEIYDKDTVHNCPKGGSGWVAYEVADCGKEEHTHSDACCSKAAHTHGPACCSKEEHTHMPTVCFECSSDGMTYTKKEHSHLAWNSANQPGCYVTVWVCPGHCGGHITPQVDVVQDMTYESLVHLDSYKVTKQLQEDDFKTGGITLFNITSGAGTEPGMSDNFRTVEAWKGFWNAKALSWFSIFPSSPEAFRQSVRKTIVYYGASAIDKVTGLISKGVSWLLGTDGATDETAQTALSNAESDEDDLYDFTGWFETDEEGNIQQVNGQPVLNQEQLDDVRSMYNDEENYKEAVENWRDIGDVRFPTGNTIGLTTAKIEEIMDSLPEDLSEYRRNVIREALESVGRYAFSTEISLTSAGRGKVDNPTFVQRALCEAMDREISCPSTVSGWAAAATRGGSMQPGDILVNTTQWIGSTTGDETGDVYGDVCIFIGKQGDQYMVIRCTPDKNGGGSKQDTIIASKVRSYSVVNVERYNTGD